MVLHFSAPALLVAGLMLSLSCRGRHAQPMPPAPTAQLIVVEVDDPKAFLAQLSADLGSDAGRVTVAATLDDERSLVVSAPGTLGSERIPQDGPGWRVRERRVLRVMQEPGPRVEAPYAAVVRQRVEDYGRWLAAFDDLSEARAQAGIEDVRVSQSVDDPHTVHLYAYFADPERYAALFRSATLRERLAQGGVIGVPEVVKVRHLSLPAQ